MSEPSVHYTGLLLTAMSNNTENGCGGGKGSRFSDLLQAGWSGNRIPVEGQIFRIRPHRSWEPQRVPGLSGVKRPGHGVDHPPPSSAEIKERAQL